MAILSRERERELCVDSGTPEWYKIIKAVGGFVNDNFKFGSSTTMHPTFDPTAVRTHDLQLMTKNVSDGCVVRAGISLTYEMYCHDLEVMSSKLG